MRRWRSILVGGFVAAMFLCSLGLHPTNVSSQVLPEISDVVGFVGPLTITLDSDNDNPAAVDLVGGSGTYGFRSLACYEVSDGEGLAPVPEPDECTLTSTGTFDNSICGNGHTNGTATVTSTHGLGDDLTVTYSIVFSGSIGIVSGTVSGTSPDGSGTIPGAQMPDGTETIFTGVVLAAPPIDLSDLANTVVHDTGPGLGEDCTTGLTVIGNILVNEDGTS